MIFERHKRGRVFGGQVEICPDSYLCPQSHAEGNADIWQSHIEKSRIKFDSKVRQSRIENLSTVGSEDSKCEVSNSRLTNTNFYGGTALNCYINGSRIEGTPYFRGTRLGVTIVNSTIKDNVRLEGEAKVFGVTLERFMRVGAGIWTRAPRYLHVKTEDVELGVTESVEGFAYIRCEHKPIAKWLKKRSLWQKAAGWSDGVGKQIALALEEWMDVKIPTCEV